MEKTPNWIHIYRAVDQPATRFELDVSNEDEPIIIEYPPYKLLHCYSCGRLMAAKDLIAHAYYDGTYFFCREKEYGRAPEFPFEYRHICKGTALKPRRE